MIGIRTLAASLFAVFAATTPLSATAADLYGENYRPDDGQGYDEDQRYSESERPYDNGYAEGQDYDQPRYRGSTKDGEYLPPLDRTPRFSENGYNGRNDRYGCTPRWQVRNRLIGEGWRNFRRLAVRDNVVVLRANRYDGRAFDIKVDRCSGEIVAQRPARLPGYGAYGPGPRRYGWAY